MKSALQMVDQNYGNPSSLHAAGEDAKDLLRDCREKVAKAINAKPSEIVFTSGGTESNSLVLNNLRLESKGLVKIISQVEHSSVFNCKPDFTIPVTKECLLEVDKLEDIVQKFNPALVSVMLANNETGTILDPHGELYKLKEKYKFILHVDAVQAFGKIEIDVKKTPVDFLSLSAHKIHGLKGAGALYISSDLDEKFLPEPLFIGGSHERGLRPGTENQLGIWSLAYMANKIHNDSSYKSEIKNLSKLRDRLEDLLSDLTEVNGSKEHRVGNTSNMYFHSLGGTKETHLDLFLQLLSESGVCVSGKSACASGMPAPSRVLSKMFGEDSLRLHNSIRVSLSVDTTEKEISRAAQIIRECHEECRKMIGEINE